MLIQAFNTVLQNFKLGTKRLYSTGIERSILELQHVKKEKTIWKSALFTPDIQANDRLNNLSKVNFEFAMNLQKTMSLSSYTSI